MASATNLNGSSTTSTNSDGDLPTDSGGNWFTGLLDAAGDFGNWLSSNFGLSDAEAATMQQILENQKQTQKAVLYVSLLSIATGGFVVWTFNKED